MGEIPCLTADDDHGFVIDEAEVVYWGRCPACIAQGRAPMPPVAPTRRSRRTAQSENPAAAPASPNDTTNHGPA